MILAYTRFLYGEKTDGTEWSTSLSYARGWEGDSGRVGATWLYAGVDGQTEPYDFVKNYKVGVRFRRQAYRDFLFWEIDPSYNWRIDEPYLDREGAWRIELRLEFLMFDNPQQTLERQIRCGDYPLSKQVSGLQILFSERCQPRPHNAVDMHHPGMRVVLHFLNEVSQTRCQR